MKHDEERIRHPNRREFLDTIGKYTSLAGMASLYACKNNPGPGPTPTPNPVTQNIQVLTSDGRNLGIVSYQGIEGQPVLITPQNLQQKGISLETVSQQLYVLRENPQADRLGGFVANTAGGNLSFQPSNNARTLYMMNSQNNTDYNCAWSTGFGLSGILQRYATAEPLTNNNNPAPSIFQIIEGIDLANLIEGLEILNRAMLVNGIKYAEIRWQNSSGNAAIKAGLGYSIILPQAQGYHVLSPVNSYIVRYDLPASVQRMISAGEASEVFYKTNNPCGISATSALFENTDLEGKTLSNRGNDLVRMAALMSSNN